MSNREAAAMTASVIAILHRIGTSNPLLSSEDKMALQFAVECLADVRNHYVDESEKEPAPTLIVTASKGAMVNAVSGISHMFPLIDKSEMKKKKS